MNVHLVIRDGTVSERCLLVSKWFEFHDVRPRLCVGDDPISFAKGKTLVITDDLYPSPQLVQSVVTDKSVCTTITDYPTSEGGWFPSFCFLGNVEEMNVTPKKFVSRIRRGEIETEHNDEIITCYEHPKNEVENLNRDCANEHDLETRYNVLSGIVVKYWYEVSNLVVARYYSHLWMNAYQKWACSTINLDGKPSDESRDRFNWVRQQSCFSHYFEMVEVEKPLKWAIKETIKSKVPLGSPLKGYMVKTGVHSSRLHNHPLILNGLYTICPTPDLHEEDYDTSVTMVGFYYNLGYSQKPKEHYLESLDKYTSIRHPLIFFGDSGVCDYVRKRRNPLFTKIVEKPIGEWSLIDRYRTFFPEATHNDEELVPVETFDDSDTGEKTGDGDREDGGRIIPPPVIVTKKSDALLGEVPQSLPQTIETLNKIGHFANSPRYAILTNLKVYAVNEAAKMNPFNSETFVWHDPGFYRHGYMAEHLKMGTPIFKDLEIFPGKITVPSLTSVPSSTDEQYLQTFETIISYIMGGDAEAWFRLLTESERLIHTKFDKGEMVTEQVLQTRLATLTPDLFNIKFSNYAPYNVNRFIGDGTTLKEIALRNLNGLVYE